MKTVLLLLSLTFIVSCKNNSETKIDDSQLEASAKEFTMKGAWKLISYYNYQDNEVSDTISASDTNKQIKMYTDTKVMWSRFRDSDTLDWFAYGNYSIGNGILTEVLDYGSKSMNEAIKEQKEFNFKLILDANTFSQVQTDEEGNAIYAENYLRIE
ncbi:MAG: hypothetical protein GW839_05550 [Flavobacteriales bacterium]|nr:hypothetical protein [Flavobacteriia bacterium]NCP05680.1 hypothetical protein [Flavobacteriales bacterium]PIV93689.1 MAG: hypothetical protein COW44_08165 [Flavobacteriaceae bacterium CG17_big_fil_post_rev_8_21_14_2_50_33_15]PIY13331.1 MAG: hypothetical protein COZ17_00990 [Flavobacteriaceae bacterium CG_4_10_14_3_um_filter_33_47]PJB17725.1 MAG: hypothetical protein CO117_10515 [Flavobacteriaceae bacterium CG_4_9_14_3_um_filter_33_16]